jgi:hypothetical protein
MATPTTVEARAYAAGAKKAATWGTEVALGTGCEIKLLKSSNLPQAYKRELVTKKESNYTGFARRILGGVGSCDFTVESYMRYDAGPLGEFLAELFGTAGAPSTVETGVYLHTFQWADSSSGLFSTYAEEYPGKIYSVPSAKPIKAVFTLEEGIVKLTTSLRGNNVIVGSAVNGATQMDALTCVNDEDEVRFDQMDEVWVNLASTAPLAAADQRTISGMELTFGRGLEDPKPTAGATTLTEAQEEDVSDVRVKLDFPYDDSFNREFFEDFVDDTPYAMIFHFKGALLGATAYYEMTLYYPQLRLAAVPDLTKEGIVKVTAEFVAIPVSAAPSGFSYTRPYMTLQNARSTDYLA